MTVAARPRNSIRLRGRSLLAFVLAPEMPLDEWMQDLDAWLERSPGFFTGRPVLLDVSALKLDREGLGRLLQDLRERDVRIMGIEGTNSAWLELGMPPAVERERQNGMAEVLEGATNAAAPRKADAAGGPLIIDGQVRSGQSVEHDGDVIVTGSVASGAEVIAGGTIHVYGALRGRAIAGSTGDSQARIFCNRLEAEFLGVDGIFQTAEELDPEIRGCRVQVRADEEELRMTTLNSIRESR